MWFTETPWPPIYLCLAIFVVFFAYGSSTGRAKSIFIGLLFLLACPLLFLVERQLVTESEVVEQIVLDLADDVEHNRVDAVLDYLDEDSAVVRGLIQSGMTQYKVSEGLRVTDLYVEMESEGDKAKAHLRANGSVSQSNGGMQSGHFPSLVHLLRKGRGRMENLSNRTTQPDFWADDALTGNQGEMSRVKLEALH
ncbi:MAG: hypothetical protein R3C11_08590 [Planctomycetaceae bacterium]